jgi:cytochrome c oxidase assembly protein subunit 15
VATTGVILVQLILGAVYRHGGMGVESHVAGACVVTMLVAWMVARIMMKFAQARALLRPALFLATLVMLQLSLGLGAYLAKMSGRSAPHPLPPVVNMTTAHVAVGALVLVTSLYMTYQTYRFLAAPAAAERVASAPHGAAL